MRIIYNMQPMLRARDLRETIDFYTNVLGFTVDGTFPEEAPTWCGMHSGNARMMWTSLPPGAQAPAFNGRIYMYPDDIDAVWERLRGITDVVEPLSLTEYDMREFTIRDPNGYEVSFGNSAGQHEHDEHGNHI